MEILQKIEGSTKLFIDLMENTPVMVMLSVCSGIVVFMPHDLRVAVGIGFVEPVRGWLFLLWLVSAASTLVYQPLKFMRNWYAQRRISVKRMEMISQLSAEEKQLLWTYIAQETKSLYFPAINVTAKALTAAGILGKPGGYENLQAVGYVLQPWAWQMIKEYPELLDGRAQGPYPEAQANAWWN